MPPNPSQDTQEFRRERLSAAAKQAGGNAPLGRLLGYRDGAFVGQMLRGERPITEKTVTALESKPGYRDWFAATGNVVQEPPASYSEPLALSPSERDLVLALRKLSQADQQETIRDVMHRAEAVEKMVERVLSDRGISFSAYLSATRAAETLPAPPAGQRIPDRKPGDPDEMESPISRKQQWPESKEGKS